jgi:hypothetical protein
MLGLVAPVTMSADQQTLWLASAVDALQDIRVSEVQAVSAEVRRSATRYSQIVPEIARLVAERRARESSRITAPLIEGPPRKVPVMDRRGQPMSEEDTNELNGILENLGANARYRSDGSRYFLSDQSLSSYEERR